MSDWKKHIKAECDFHHREILETDVCEWCGEKKAIITDGWYVYCSKGCKNLFIDNAHEAIKQACERNFEKE